MKLEEKDLEQLYEYCKKVGPGDRYFKECEDKIIKRKNPKISYLFTYDIKGADIRAHGQVILDSKDPKWNFYFAKDIYGADIEAHRQIVNTSGNKEWIDKFEKYLPRTHNQTQSENKTSKDSENTNTDPNQKSKKLRELVIERNKVKNLLGYNKSERESGKN